jgi:UDP-N-acetylmuramyl tripeptide synthase
MTQVGCDGVTPDGEGMRMFLSIAGAGIEVALPLSGLYNAYNVTAAAALAHALGIGRDAIRAGLSAFTAAFGRQERLEVDGRRIEVILAKNPAGLNQVIRTIIADTKGPLHLAMFLNDGLADGRDISWIWDVDFELLNGWTSRITVSGTRAWDLAVRLKYAGLEAACSVEKDAKQALRHAIRQTPENGALHVIPTYTAMLEVRDTLAGWAGSDPFWETK